MSRLWPVTLVLALLLSVVSFTPVVIPEGEIQPTLGGIPVTLWTGVVVAFVFIILTYVAGRVHPEIDESGDDGESI